MHRILSSCVAALFAFLAVSFCAGAQDVKNDISKLDPNLAVVDPTGEWLWYDARKLTIEGKGWTDTEAFYDRLPAKAKGAVRDAVWTLSRHSAGMCARFVTDAGKISGRWSVSNDSLAMPHMPATGVSGLDLYVRDGKPGEGPWRWIGTGVPKNKKSEAVLVTGLPEGSHEFMLYLPLYNGADSLEVGLPPKAVIVKGPQRPAERAKPIVFYGTSIVHGGCAARPGMAYPAILGRHLDWPIINLGFSGNGTMDPELGPLFSEIEAAAYVLDCLPNMDAARVTERAAPFVKALRAAHPDTPIVLVENIRYQAAPFLAAANKYKEKNAALREAYQKLLADGVKNLSYIDGDALLGDDSEASVDGTHPTDLGFMRMAGVIEPVLREALHLK